MQSPPGDNLIGIIPAAGLATRAGKLPCSKEIYPVSMTRDAGVLRPKAACEYLLDSMQVAGIQRACVVLRRGKWDIPDYLGDGSRFGPRLAYLVVDESPAVPWTLSQPRLFAGDAIVATGFPDIVFQPRDALLQLVDRQRETGADIVLGLFPAQEPHKTDMTVADGEGRVTQLVIKPVVTDLRFGWILAVWSPVFSDFMCRFVNRLPPEELFVGDVFQAAINDGMHVNSVTFEDGWFLDVGTPEGLALAVAQSLK